MKDTMIDNLFEFAGDFNESSLKSICNDVTGDPKYRVHFICADCKIPWYYDTVLVSQALLKAKQEGCPLCNQTHRLVLTHHEELVKEETKNIPDIREFMVIGVFNGGK